MATTTSSAGPALGASRGRTLDAIVKNATTTRGLRHADVRPGDWILVRTKNSTYSLAALGEGRYRVVGGWFAAADEDGRDVRVAGCTWGGAAINTSLVAVPGLFLEFDNGVRTTRIQDVQLLRGGDRTTH